MHFWNHGGIGAYRVSKSEPLVMGHEASGVVHAIGSGVENVKVGDNVAIEPGTLDDRDTMTLSHLFPLFLVFRSTLL